MDEETRIILRREIGFFEQACKRRGVVRGVQLGVVGTSIFWIVVFLAAIGL